MYKISKDVLSRDVGDEEVILDLESQLYYGLNPTAARIWQLLKQGKPARDIARAIADEFDVPAATAQKDVSEFIGRLEEKHLIARENA